MRWLQHSTASAEGEGECGGIRLAMMAAQGRKEEVSAKEWSNEEWSGAWC